MQLVGSKINILSVTEIMEWQTRLLGLSESQRRRLYILHFNKKKEKK